MAQRPSRTTEPSDKVAEVMPEHMADKANGVAIPTQRFDDDALRSISSFDDAIALLTNEGIEVADASQTLGNGFAVLQDKNILCGIPMALLSWNFNQGDNGEFVSINVVAQFPGMNQPGKFVVNDGSSGIYKQLRHYSDRTKQTAGMIVRKGLRRSDYDYTNPATGETSNATTYYLDTSA